jgi:hypothetical protein
MEPSRPRTVQFWEGVSAKLDLLRVERSAMSVKGCICPNPLRFLEIYQSVELVDWDGPSVLWQRATMETSTPAERHQQLRRHPWSVVQGYFLPEILDTSFSLGDDIQQPPYVWRECDPNRLAINFTYKETVTPGITALLVSDTTPEIEPV